MKYLGVSVRVSAVHCPTVYGHLVPRLKLSHMTVVYD